MAFIVENHLHQKTKIIWYGLLIKSGLADFKILGRESNLRQAILKALSDEYSRTIMNYTIEQPKSVIDMVRDCNVPMTTAYRRVHELEENKILKVTGSIITDDGKKVFFVSKPFEGHLCDFWFRGT